MYIILKCIVLKKHSNGGMFYPQFVWLITLLKINREYIMFIFAQAMKSKAALKVP